MDSFLNRFRHTARRLARTPVFTFITLVTLAIGIGANTAIFSVISGVLLKPLPYSEPDRLVGIWHSAKGIGLDLLNDSPSTYFTYREENRVFENIALWQDDSSSVTGLAEPERVDGIATTFELFPVLRAKPAAGRLFSSRDDSPDSPETVILSYAYWQRKFGGRPDAIGRRLIVDGKAREIIGAMPQDFRFLDREPALYLPLRLDRAKVFSGNFSHQSLARLKPGVTIAQANADIARILPMMLDKFPPPPGMSRNMFERVRMEPNIRPLKEDVVGDIGKVLWVLMGTVGIVLLIACANVANLFLVRAEGRQQELAIRTALGASWGRLARELLSESIGLGLAGGVLGVALAYGGIRLLVALSPGNVPRLDAIRIDGPVLAFTLLISVVAGILFGLIPIFKFTRRETVTSLKEGGRSASDGKGRQRARNVLVASQIALALVLLVSAGLMIRTFQALRHVDPGFVRPEEVLTLRISIPDAVIQDPVQVARTHAQILERIRQIPGVVSTGLSSAITMDGNNSNDPIFVEDSPTPPGQLPPIRRFKFVAAGYFETMGNRLLAGRDFNWTDIYETRPVVVVSENLARLYWKTPAAALGKRVRETPASPWREVVGVVGNDRDDGVNRKSPETVYWPLMVGRFWDQERFIQRTPGYVIRSTRTGTQAFLGEIRNAVWSVNPNLPIANVQTLKTIYGRSMSRTSFTLVMLAIASSMALLLGLVGIYGVISYSVSQRTREIGIRMALGAQHPQVRRMFVRHALVLTAFGIGIGIAAAAALTRGMSALLFETSSIDPLTYISVALGLACAAMLASYLPARRATVIDPVRALRAE